MIMDILPIHTPVAVIGAGPVGMLAALLLHRQGKQVLLLEMRPPNTVIRDRRTLALSFSSMEALHRAGITIPENQYTPITYVHISQQGTFGHALLRNEDMGTDVLGYSVDYAVLMQACEAALIRQGVPVLWETQVNHVRTLNRFAEVYIRHRRQSHSLTADWVILAEGGHLTENLPGITRHSFDYNQSAIVTTLEFEQNGNGTAYERFIDDGPFALLPYGTAYRLVWTRSHEEAARIKTMAFTEFAEMFETAFGNRLGRLKKCGDIAAFPLQLKQLSQVYSGRIICIGNAAQTMHPVAAQGLNLGVRDVLTLIHKFAEPHSMHNTRLAEQYAAERRLDAQAVVGFTHSLVTLFDHPNALLKLGRGGVMSLLDSVPALRKKFTEHLIFGL